MYVTSLSGAMVPLTQIATIEPEDSPNVIRHFNKERYAAVTSFKQSGYNTIKLFNEIESKEADIHLPAGYKFISAGEKESQKRIFLRHGSDRAGDFLFLFAILVLEFRTFKSTLIVLSVIPLGIVGALIILFFAGETISFVATVGMVALMGIEIKNSILLVDYTNHLREQGMPLRKPF